MIATDKNSKFRLILKLASEQYEKNKEIGINKDGFDTRCVEFTHNKSLSEAQKDWLHYYDSDGSLTGCALELSSRGYFVPIVIPRFGPSGFSFLITSVGLELAKSKERIEKEFPVAEDNFAFVIMSFSDDKSLKDAYELAIKPSVIEAGFKCLRVDEIEHNRRITDKVIECIKKARFIVAELTEQRPNCYYELGYAHAIEKDVIHVINKKDPIHFDIKDFNFIVYESIVDLKNRLKKRIEETIK